MKRKSIPIRAAAQCAEWNRLNPQGSPVIVTKDSGAEVHTKTRGDAYVCDSGYPVIFLEGISGYYLLERVRPAPSASGSQT